MSDSNDTSRADAELRDAVGSIKAVHENSSPRGVDADDSDADEAAPESAAPAEGRDNE